MHMRLSCLLAVLAGFVGSTVSAYQITIINKAAESIRYRINWTGLVHDDYTGTIPSGSEASLNTPGPGTCVKSTSASIEYSRVQAGKNEAEQNAKIDFTTKCGSFDIKVYDDYVDVSMLGQKVKSDYDLDMKTQ